MSNESILFGQRHRGKKGRRARGPGSRPAGRSGEISVGQSLQFSAREGERACLVSDVSLSTARLWLWRSDGL